MTSEVENFVEGTISHAVCKLLAAKETCFNICMKTSQTEPMPEADLDQLFGVSYIIEDTVKQLEEARNVL